jgi:hypothetical protein
VPEPRTRRRRVNRRRPALHAYQCQGTVLRVLLAPSGFDIRAADRYLGPDEENMVEEQTVCPAAACLVATPMMWGETSGMGSRKR